LLSTVIIKELSASSILAKSKIIINYCNEIGVSKEVRKKVDMQTSITVDDLSGKLVTILQRLQKNNKALKYPTPK